MRLIVRGVYDICLSEINASDGPIVVGDPPDDHPVLHVPESQSSVLIRTHQDVITAGHLVRGNLALLFKSLNGLRDLLFVVPLYLPDGEFAALGGRDEQVFVEDMTAERFTGHQILVVSKSSRRLSGNRMT